jgi:glycogen synthase kinase 3 beta
MSAIESMCHPFFDELREPGAKMPNGKDLPDLFNFTAEGKGLFESVLKRVEKVFVNYVELSIRPDLIHKLVPAHLVSSLNDRGIDIDNFNPIPLEELRISLD